MPAPPPLDRPEEWFASGVEDPNVVVGAPVVVIGGGEEQ
jgi:hypothetical protein